MSTREEDAGGQTPRTLGGHIQGPDPRPTPHPARVFRTKGKRPNFCFERCPQLSGSHLGWAWGSPAELSSMCQTVTSRAIRGVGWGQWVPRGTWMKVDPPETHRGLRSRACGGSHVEERGLLLCHVGHPRIVLTFTHAARCAEHPQCARLCRRRTHTDRVPALREPASGRQEAEGKAQECFR